jgi:phosphotriesterase-related protein
MAQLQTVKGPLDSEALGLTLLHEHVLWQFDDSRRKESIEFAAKLLNEAAKVGVKSLVDLTPHRRIDWYMEIAAQTPVNLIPCTGYYHYRGFLSQALAAFSEDQMVARMVNELTAGIDHTPVRAGIIKVAGVDPVLTPWEVQVFTAAAKAHLKTGACIATHAVAGARAQAEVLLRAGANLNQVFFSHIDTEVGFEGRSIKEQARYLEEIARLGGGILLNNFGCTFYTAPEHEIYLMKHLCDAGLQEKVLISIDCNWTWNKAGKIEFEEEANHPEAGERTYAFMMTDTVLELLKGGFTDQDLQAFLIDNPRKFFDRSGSR